jgi:two-component system sensor histidine kinase KdpD
LGLVNDINDSFRLQSHAMALQEETVSVIALLEGAVAENARPDLLSPSILLEGPAPSVSVDPRLMRRVIGNLIGNAYKHAGPSARVALRAGTAGADVLIAVEDDGNGIPETERERVFERFVQGDGAGPGSGLGLAFCKLVIERHNGRIWVEASTQGGARICFTVPATDALLANAG